MNKSRTFKLLVDSRGGGFCCEGVFKGGLRCFKGAKCALKREMRLFSSAVFVRFCSPVRLEFLAHAFCACCGKCLHTLCAVAVGN